MALYLITGGAGFIGSHLAHALVARGDRVRVLDDFSSGREVHLAALGRGPIGSGAPCEVVRGDIVDLTACRAAMDGVDGVLHQAALVSVARSVREPLRGFDVNVRGTLQLLEAAREAGTPRFVLASSSSAYGNAEELPKHEGLVPQPLSPYAAGKVAAEHMLRAHANCYGIACTALRYFNVFGPRQRDDSPYTGVIPIFVRALLDGRTPTIFGDGEQTRDFTYVDNVVAANLAALDVETGYRVLNVGGGERVSLNALDRAIAQELGGPRRPRRPRRPLHGPERTGDVRHSLASLDRAREVLGYRPSVPWREGLARTIAWYRATSARPVAG